MLNFLVIRVVFSSILDLDEMHISYLCFFYNKVRKERCQLDTLIRARSAVDPCSSYSGPTGDSHMSELCELKSRHAALQKEFETRSIEVEIYLYVQLCKNVIAAINHITSNFYS